MPSSSRRRAGVVACALMLVSSCAAAQHAVSAAPAPAWSYAGDGAPDHWANLDPAFAACASGRAQSPIDIPLDALTTATTRVSATYPGAFTNAIHRGHVIEFHAGAGSRMATGTDSGSDSYALVQMHFHTPSEHTVDGRAYPLEAHYVHRNAQGGLAVLGLLFRDGPEDPGVAALWAHLPKAEGASLPLALPVADLWDPSRLAFVTYPGSLTTPPCGEGVRWFVADTRLTVSPSQIARLVSTAGANARPIQPLNGRKVWR